MTVRTDLLPASLLQRLYKWAWTWGWTLADRHLTSPREHGGPPAKETERSAAPC